MDVIREQIDSQNLKKKIEQMLTGPLLPDLVLLIEGSDFAFKSCVYPMSSTVGMT